MSELDRLSAIQDALRRRRPDVVADLEERFPDLGLTGAPRRPLGTAAAPLSPGVHEYAEVAYEEARAELSEMLQILGRKIRWLARLRLIVGVASALSTGSLVALILGRERGQLLAGGIAFGMSTLSVYITYLEDFSGGDGSTKKMREVLMAQARQLADAGAQLRMGRVLGRDDNLISSLTLINEAFAEAQVVRAQLGLPL